MKVYRAVSNRCGGCELWGYRCLQIAMADKAESMICADLIEAGSKKARLQVSRENCCLVNKADSTRNCE
jgi:hypothetical protein